VISQTCLALQNLLLSKWSVKAPRVDETKRINKKNWFMRPLHPDHTPMKSPVASILHENQLHLGFKMKHL
jgi:hypothetical protein